MSVLTAEPSTTVGRWRTGMALLDVRDLTKRFGPISAVDSVSLTLGAGEILGVLGENGAGKSTLLNMLAGMVRPDSGVIAVNGRRFSALTPGEAIRHGIGTVYQHFALVSSLTVRENLLLGTHASGGFARSVADEGLRTTLDLLDLPLALDAQVRSLSMGERQRLEIAKVLARGSKILLLDEPTSVLTPQEVDRLFAVLRRVRDSGVGIVLVTHKLGEALGLCHRILVMRGGRLRGEVERSQSIEGDAARDRVVELMFGGQRAAETAAMSPPPSSAVSGDAVPVLQLDHVQIADDRGHVVVPDLSLELFEGELFGIAGVDGNGQRELAEAVAGQRPIASGYLRLLGRDLSAAGVQERRAAGIGYVTDDRRAEGAAIGSDIAENLVLKAIDTTAFSRHGLIDRRAIRSHASRLMARFDIRAPGPDTPAGRLSGGNLQKVLLAREIAASPRLLVCKDPTHGLDVRTATHVIGELRSHAALGNAVLLISSDLDELLACCDRVGVIYRGELVGVLPRSEAHPTVLGHLMLGGSQAAASVEVEGPR